MANALKPINLDETQKEIVAKLEAIKQAILEGGGGGGVSLPEFETLQEVEDAINRGQLKEGDYYTINDYEDIVGSTDISDISDGTLTGAISELSETTSELKNNSIRTVGIEIENYYTVAEDGLVRFIGNQGSHSWGYFDIKINEISVYSKSNAGTSKTESDVVMFVPVKKNDTIRWSVANAGTVSAMVFAYS